MPDLNHSRIGNMVVVLAIAGGVLSATYLRLAAAQPAAESTWMPDQKKQQEQAASGSAIRYLCANHMAFELDPSGTALVRGENKIVVADEEAKRRCRLPWMPVLRDITTFMSAVSPANGYGASFVTTGESQDQIMQNLRRAGWRESSATETADLRGHGEDRGAAAYHLQCA